MTSYVDINDQGAARAAASTLAALGRRLQRQSTPPEVVWGDDELGTTMQYTYPDRSTVPETLDQKQELGEELSKVGTGLSKAIKELRLQEGENARDIDAVHPPNL